MQMTSGTTAIFAAMLLSPSTTLQRMSNLLITGRSLSRVIESISSVDVWVWCGFISLLLFNLFLAISFKRVLVSLIWFCHFTSCDVEFSPGSLRPLDFYQQNIPPNEDAESEKWSRFKMEVTRYRDAAKRALKRMDPIHGSFAPGIVKINQEPDDDLKRIIKRNKELQ